MNIQPLKHSTRCAICPTRQVCLAKDLDASRLAQLESITKPFLSLKKNTYVYRVGDAARQHYHVRSGILKTYAINANGDEYVTGFYLPGEIFGMAENDAKHTDSAVALETATVCELAKSDINKLAEAQLAAPLFKLLAERDDRLAQHILNLSQSRADARIAGFLIDMARRLGSLGRCSQHIPIPMSRTDLANYLGLTLETLSRTLSALVKAGALKTSRDFIEVLEPEAIDLLGIHLTR